VSHGSPLMEELPELRRLAESHAAVQWADRIMKKRLIMCFRAEEPTQTKLMLKARVNRSDAQTIRHALEQLSAKGSVTKADDEFVVEAEMEGLSARELNRTSLSALRWAFTACRNC
jgi:hypothetical protein